VKQIAIYGKGGIGKSTISANLSAALAERGLRVLQIGCDPKHDSTKLLLGGKVQTTVLDLLKDRAAKSLTRNEIVLNGYRDVACIEAGGPEPGVGCAGRGILSMASALETIGLDLAEYDIVVYDVLGDVVCGGFAVPMRDGYADEVYVVTSGEIMSLYAANNICKGMLRFGGKLGGIIANARDVPCEKELLQRFAREIGSELIAFFPRDHHFRDAELNRRTVMENAPASDLAEQFRILAENIATRDNRAKPNPLAEDHFEQIIFEVAGGKPPEEKLIPQDLGVQETSEVDTHGFENYLTPKDEQARSRISLISPSYRAKALREDSMRVPLHSCALAGAFSITNHIVDGITIMHSPAGCAHTSLSAIHLAGEALTSRGLETPPTLAIPRLICTNLKETDCVQGGEKTLENKIRTTVTQYRPKAVFLITSCPSAIVGDDPLRVAQQVADLKVPIVVMETEGIMGGDYSQGMINAYKNLIDTFIVPARGIESDPSLINLVGEEPISNRADEDLQGLMPLFKAMGIRINTRFVRQTTVDRLRGFCQAAFSIQMSNSDPALVTQKILEERAVTQFLRCPPPVGFEGTRRFLNALSLHTGRPAPAELIHDAEVERKEKIARLRPVLGGKRIFLGIYTQDVSWISELVESLDFQIIGIASVDSCMNETIGDMEAPHFEAKDSKDLLRHVAELKPDLYLANYVPRGIPVACKASAVPLCPPLGFNGAMKVAEHWARALFTSQEEWRFDRRFARENGH